MRMTRINPRMRKITTRMVLHAAITTVEMISISTRKPEDGGGVLSTLGGSSCWANRYQVMVLLFFMSIRFRLL